MKMQCKDIPTQPILEFVAVHGGIGCGCRWDFMLSRKGEQRLRELQGERIV